MTATTITNRRRLIRLGASAAIAATAAIAAGTATAAAGDAPHGGAVEGYATRYAAPGVLGQGDIGVRGIGRVGGSFRGYEFGLLVEGPVRTDGGLRALAVDAEDVTVGGSFTMSRNAGVVSVPAGARTAKVVSASIDVRSIALATLQTQTQGLSVESAVTNRRGGLLTITLSKAVPAGTTARVGWMIVN
jgi:hypothetical protein